MRTSIITTIILSIFFSPLASELQSQAYRPMAVEGATWVYSGFGDYQGQSATYHLSGDTLIDNKTYKNVWLGNSWIGYMRDDSLNRKVYGGLKESGMMTLTTCDPFLLESQEVEKLLYDFDLTVGDTIIESCYMDIFEIMSEDFEPYLNDVWRVLSSRSIHGSLYEGLGTYDGIFVPLGTIAHAGKGLSLVDYCISDNGLCTTATQNILDDSEIKVFPNPVEDRLRIETERVVESILVYDFNGRLLLRGHTKELDLNSLDAGSYLVEILLEHEYIYRTKVIKI